MWLVIKELVDRYGCKISYIEEINRYQIWVCREGKVFECSIKRETPANADQIDFENGYKFLV